MSRRADNVDETRLRIVAATVDLHGTIGPAATTVSAVAEAAGVTRLTVYRHFPDEEALLAACSAHWMAGHRPPDIATWSAVADPVERLRYGLADLYRYFRGGADMLTNVYRDFDHLPASHRERLRDRERVMTDVLADGFAVPDARRRLLRAVIGHAVAFGTWRSLCHHHGLTDTEAIEVLVAAATV